MMTLIVRGYLHNCSSLLSYMTHMLTFRLCPTFDMWIYYVTRAITTAGILPSLQLLQLLLLLRLLLLLQPLLLLQLLLILQQLAAAATITTTTTLRYYDKYVFLLS